MTTDHSNFPSTDVTQTAMSGFYVDHDGNVRDVNNPGDGMICIIESGLVLVCGPHDEVDGREVLDQYVYYPTLEALESIGISSTQQGQAVMARPRSV